MTMTSSPSDSVSVLECWLFCHHRRRRWGKTGGTENCSEDVEKGREKERDEVRSSQRGRGEKMRQGGKH